MPRRETAPIGAPCWVDLLTSDVEASRRFYSELFDWVAGEPDEQFGGYFIFTKNGSEVGGCMGKVAGMPGGETPDGWSTYLASDDARKTVETAQARGGSVYVEPMDIADMGTMAVLGDPTGSAIGVWQPATFQGFPVVAETGVPSWFELYTRDYDTAVAFYGDVFRAETDKLSDTPEFRYTILKDGADMVAGIMDASGLPADHPTGWAVYFGVDNTDAALAKAVELGGAVVRPAEDTPYGRLATATDTTGAPFKLVSPNESMPARG